MKAPILALALTAAASCAAHAADAQTPAQFYAGKQIDFIIGSAAGGGYGVYAEMFAQHFGKHIPGSPRVVPRLMDGAGSITAANQLFFRAPKDGTTIGAVFTGAVVEPLIGDRKKAPYDSRRFGYIGSANRESSVCFARKDVNFKNWDDAFQKQLIISAAGWTSSIRQFPAVLNAIVKTKFKIVTGYPGSRESVEAVEKGESQGVCGIQWSSFAPTYINWVKNGTVTVFGQIASTDGDPQLNAMGVPNLWPAIKNPEDKEVLHLVFDQQEFGRPYITPPGVPADRLEALRKAFDDTMKDPDFLADAKRANLPISPMQGADIQKAVDAFYGIPDRLVDRARQALE